MYLGLPYDQEELAQAMRKTYAELIDFVTSPEFKAVWEELGSLRPEERPDFVRSVLLNKEELKKRGVVPTEGILIQRSAFGDRRPTLFCVKKYLPEKYHSTWENVNLTFDNPFNQEDISRKAEVAWRRPLPVEVQSQLMASGIDLEELDDDFGGETGVFGTQEVPSSRRKDAT